VTDSKIKDVFSKTEGTLIQNGNLPQNARKAGKDEQRRLLNNFRTDNDDDFYSKLALIVFFSGFRASVVEKKKDTILKYFSSYKKAAKYSEVEISRMLTDKQMIKNERKIRALIFNAKAFEDIVSKHGSFRQFLLSFNPHFPLSRERIDDLRLELMKCLKYLGPATVNHFLTDYAFPVLKPDRMVMRVMHRAHLVKNEGENEYEKAIQIGNRIAKLNDVPIRYVDSVFVMLGQAGEANICRKTKPLCEICQLSKICNYYG